MDRIQLTTLRDIACTYLPTAKKHLEEARTHWMAERNLDEALAFDAMRAAGRLSSTGVELAAAELLSALCGVALHDPELSECSKEEAEELLFEKIAGDVKRLSKLTGCVIPFDIPELPTTSGVPESAEPPALLTNAQLGKRLKKHIRARNGA